MGGISRDDKLVPEGCYETNAVDTITTAPGVNFGEA